MARTNNFDALRLLGALLVLFSHMAALSGRVEWKWAGEHSLGNFGVLIFFSISGYLISASWRADPDLGRFLAKRFLRITPGLAVAMAITYGVVRAAGLYHFPNNPLHLLNGSLWTIEYEVLCYLLLAGAALTVKRPEIVLAAGMVIGYVLLPASYITYFGLYFAAGALLQAFPAYLDGRMVATLVAGGAMVLLLSGNTVLALAPALPPLVLWIGTRSWPVLRAAGRFGDLSYGIYVYAWPVQQIVVHLMPGASYVALVVPTLLVTIGLAWLSWRYIELPALGMKPTRSQQVAPRGAGIALG